jgi:hypothetical protein
MMERPLPESRVMPPRITITKIIPAQISSQSPTARSREVVDPRMVEAVAAGAVMMPRT